MSYIVTSEQLRRDAEGVGPKALNLLRLQTLGCRVPEFVVLRSAVIQDLSSNSLQSIYQEIGAALKGDRFAVRSAALIEDTQEHSFAGQFLTRIDVPKEQLVNAIVDVVDHAKEYLRGDLSSFSVIIQEYVVADFSGVTFTRHPSGLRQMLIEYHRGLGEDLVAGLIKPKAIECFWSEEVPSCALPVKLSIPLFQQIEKEFQHPQDIEWCLRDDEWYFLQARPITTITEDQYQGILYLDKHLPSGKPFLYGKTEISEIAARPTPFTFSLLQRLYAEGGPIQRVYKKYGLSFESKDFLRLVGNQLYVDREEELETILPAYGYFGRKMFIPTLVRFNGLWRTWKNQQALGRMMVKDMASFIQRVDQAQAEIPVKGTPKDIGKAFDDCYALIFEINLFAGKYIQQLDLVLKKFGKTAVNVLSSSFRQNFSPSPGSLPKNTWLGNGLEIGDTEPFVTRIPIFKEDAELETWWNALPEWRRRFLQPFVERAVLFDALRERGRWLTVGYINAFRHALEGASYFVTIDEAEQNIFNEIEIKKREQLHEMTWDFPPLLSNRIASTQDDAPKGVSSGQAEGVLVGVKDLAGKEDGSYILYTETLTPDLVRYFPKIKGIVSLQGGVLSHLAILAREQGIPVVVNVRLSREGVSLGDVVRLDGDKGAIEVL